MKKPLYYATGAAAYVVIIVFVIQTLSKVIPNDTIITPMFALSLFVLSAAVMGFLFLSAPLHLYMEGKRSEALHYFGKIVGFFACFVLFFLIVLLFVH